MRNRHIRWDWNTWVEFERDKIKTMCGKTSSPKYCGIPGITSQRRLVTNSKGVLEPGWCPACCFQTYKAISSMEVVLPTINEVNVLYKKCLAIVAESAKVVAKINGEPFEMPTLERPKKSGPQRDTNGVLSKLHEGFPFCYLCQEPGFEVIDHIVPIALGGENEIWNLAKVHRSCNALKADSTFEQTRVLFPKMKLPPWFEV